MRQHNFIYEQAHRHSRLSNCLHQHQPVNGCGNLSCTHTHTHTHYAHIYILINVHMDILVVCWLLVVAFIHFYLKRVITIEHSCHHARASAVCLRWTRSHSSLQSATLCMLVVVVVSWLFACWRIAHAYICGPVRARAQWARIKCCNLTPVTRVTLPAEVAVASVHLYMFGCVCVCVLTPQRVGCRMVMTL